jgi:spore cortex formation protein SpoVR/YcgB (stage V sporulation)
MSVCYVYANYTEQHLGLVDELSTAAEYIDACKERADVYKVSRYLDTSTMLFGM